MKKLPRLRPLPFLLFLLLVAPKAGGSATTFDPSPFLGKKWFGVYLLDQKIGYGWSALERIGQGEETTYRAGMEMTLTVAQGGGRETLRIADDRTYRADGSFASFSAANTAGLGTSPARGERAGNTLRLTLPSGTRTIAAPPETIEDYLAEQILVRRGAQESEAVRAVVFDSTLLKPLATLYRVERIEEKNLSGVPTRVFVIQAEIPELGLRSLDRIDENLTVIEAKISGFLTLREEGETEAKNLSYPSDILTLTAITPRGRPVRAPAGAERLVAAVEGIADATLLSFPPRQTIQTAGTESYYLTVEKQRIDPKRSFARPAAGEAFAPFLKATPEIQSDERRIRDLAREIAGGETDALRTAEMLTAWVHAHLRKTYRAKLPNALEVLEARSGDCKAHAVLLTALARAVGLPARTVSGLVATGDGKFYYHEWAEIYVGEWMPADAAFNQVNADATHIKLGQGEPLEQAVAIASVIGRLRLEIIELKAEGETTP